MKATVVGIFCAVALGINLLCLSLGYWLTKSDYGKDDDECIPT